MLRWRYSPSGTQITLNFSNVCNFLLSYDSWCLNSIPIIKANWLSISGSTSPRPSEEHHWHRLNESQNRKENRLSRNQNDSALMLCQWQSSDQFLKWMESEETISPALMSLKYCQHIYHIWIIAYALACVYYAWMMLYTQECQWGVEKTTSINWQYFKVR